MFIKKIWLNIIQLGMKKLGLEYVYVHRLPLFYYYIVSLHSPTNCPPVLASLITECNNHDPDTRPSFRDILAKLGYLTPEDAQ